MPKQHAHARVAANLKQKNKEEDPYYLTIDKTYYEQIARVFRPFFDGDNEKMLDYLVSLTKTQLTKARAKPFEAVKAWKQY